jgi:hypothetical protein
LTPRARPSRGVALLTTISLCRLRGHYLRLAATLWHGPVLRRYCASVITEATAELHRRGFESEEVAA